MRGCFGRHMLLVCIGGDRNVKEKKRSEQLNRFLSGNSDRLIQSAIEHNKPIQLNYAPLNS